MAAEQLQIQVSANVSNAIKGLGDLEKGLKSTETAGAGLGNKGLPQVTKGANQANTAMINLGRTVSDAPFGFIGIANNIGPLVENFTQLRKEAGSSGGALKQLGASLAGPGGLIVGIQLAVSAIQFAQLGFSRWGASAKKAKEEQDKLAQGTNNLIETVTKQRVEFESLVKVARNVNQSEAERNQALTRLNEILPDTIGKLTQQNIATEQGAAIIQNYIRAVEARATAELLVSRIAENNVKLFDNRNKTLQETQRIEGELLTLRNKLSRIDINATGRAGESAAVRYLGIQDRINSLVNEQNDIQKEGRKTAEELINLNNQLRSAYESQLPLVNDLTQKQTNQKEKIDEITKILQKYREELKSIDWDEQNKAIDGTNERVKAASETLKSLYLINVQETAKAWVQVQKDFNNYADLVIKRNTEIARKSPAPEFAEPIITTIEPIADNKFFQSATDAKTKIDVLNKSFEILNKIQKENYRNWEDLRITPEILQQIKDGIPIQQITDWALKTNEVITQQKEMFSQFAGIMTNEVGGAIDSVFNSLQRGDDIFEALSDSLNQLVIDITKAVVKMLVLKAISNAIAPGSGAVVGAASSTFSVRGDYLRNAILG